MSDSSTARRQASWRAHVGELAWPTLALFGAVVIGEGLVWWGVLSGRMPIWLGSVAATLLAYASFTVLHEASHGNVHGARPELRWVGELAGWLSGLPLLAPHPMFRAIHLRHHSHTNDPERDPDFWVHSTRPLGVLARCATLLGAYEWSFFFGEVSRSRGAQSVRRQAALGVVALGALIVVLVALGLGREALLLWIFPGLAAATLLAFAFDWVPHHPHSVQGRFRDTRILLVPGLTLPMLWQNYHLVHHLYPRVPFYRYAACFREIRPELEAKGSPIEGYARGRSLPRPFGSGSDTGSVGHSKPHAEPID